MTQKTKSGLIRSLWDQDQWKHFWAIAAKAYSELRDNHASGQITLENFLKNATGLLGVIPADQYLDTMGWSLVTDTEGEVHFVKTGAPQTHSAPLTSNLSVCDVVEHCYQIGLLPRPIRRVRGNQLGESVAMSFAAAPNSPHNGPGRASSSQRADERVFGDSVSIDESTVI